MHEPVDQEQTEDASAQEQERALWIAWSSAKDKIAREELIKRHHDFARIMAGKLYARRVTDEVGFDEYLQLASVALIESIDRYNYSRGASFRTFASHRITGAILNGLESMSERSRQIALKRRIERERIESVRCDGGSTSQDTFERLADIAVGLAIGFMLDDAGLIRQDESVYPNNAYDTVLVRQVRERIHSRVAELPEREALVIRYHYLQQISFEEIGRILGVTKGRVSQIHRNGLELLRQSLGDLDRLNIEI